jgi:uncharacterized protein (TIGR02099 family)
MKRLRRALEFLAWAVFFAFAALVLALRFWFLPDIERYREDVAAAVSRSVGQTVRIGRIEAGWLGLHPLINLSDVRIHDRAGREALVLPAVENVVSWSSLAHGELRVKSLAIDKPRLAVRRDASGTFHVAGIPLAPGAGGGFADWLLSQDEIVVRNAEIEWIDQKRGAPPLALSELNLTLRNSGDEHSAGLAARTAPELGSKLELRAEFAGRAADPAAWSGRLYAALGYTDLAAWRAWIDYPWEVSQGQGAMRLWLTLRDGKLREATADVALTQVVARLGAELAPLELDSLQGRLQGRRLDGGYEFGGRGVAAAVAHGPSLAPTDFQLGWKPPAGGREEQGTARASAIDIEPLAQLSAALPVPAELRKHLAELAPRGRLTEASMEWSGALAAPQRFSVRARFSDLAIRAREKVPGFAGLDGAVEATEAKGRLVLASKNAELDLPRVFPEPPLALESLDGQVDWERQGERALSLRLSSVSFANEHLAGTAQGVYSYSGSGPGIIDLTASLSRADVSHIARYLPHASIIGKTTREWLVSGIIAGQAGDARLRLTGDLRDFPFVDPLRGQFLVTARIEKGVLNFSPGWPRIHDIDAELSFERDNMEIVGRLGTILGARLADVRVALPRLGKPMPQLAVSGQAEGETSGFLRFIQESPVRRMIKGFTDSMGAQGKGRLRLRLDLALGELAKSKVAGGYEFSANTVTLYPQLPPIERAGGSVSFTGSGFRLHDVNGRAFGGSVAFTGGTRPEGGVEVLAKGDATVGGAQTLFDHPWWRTLTGGSSYVATLGIDDDRVRIRFESSLRGVASSLPPPLGKASGEALPLRVDIIPLEGGARDRISVLLGRLAAAQIERRRDGETMAVQRTSIWLTPGKAPPRLPERPGTLIYGSLPAFDLDRWLPLASGGDAEPLAAAFDLKLGALDVSGKRINAVSLRATVEPGGWSATVSAAELAGDLAYRSEGGGKLTARLAHWRTPDDYPEATKAAIQPKDLPSLDFAAESFTWREKQVGRVELAAQRAGDEWRVERLTMTNADATLSAKGVWRGGAPSRTEVAFDLQAADAGQFLGRIGYANLVKGGKAQLRGSLAWDAEPAAIDYPSLSGEVRLQADDGQFLEIEPGLGKLVSLMSLQALPRRIVLDFRDVFSKGFQFDRISSSGYVERGVMAVKDFRMRGSSAQVEMTGDVDLARETQNLRVRVLPSLGDTASTLIGLANPLLAIPAVIAQQILKDPLGHIFAFDYAVTGSWADPKVDKLGVEARAADPASEK